MAENKDTKSKRSTAEMMAWLEEKSIQAREAAEKKAQEPRQMFLPGMDEFMRALPNPVADSSLFAPVARGVKKMHAGAVLASRLNTILTYWGVQLNELHADITMQLLWEQQRQGVAVGDTVTLNRNAFMKLIGWSNGGKDYKRFHRYMLELTGAMLVIESKKPDGASKYHIGATKTFRILDNFECDEGGENYRYRLDPRWVVMFGNREYALLDWSKRLQISGGQDLAKALQRKLATSSDPVQRFGLEALKHGMQYASPMRKFRESLAAACAELERLEIVSAWRIEDSTRGKPQLALWLPANG